MSDDPTQLFDVDPAAPAVTTGYLFAPIPEALLYDGSIDNCAVRVYGVLMRHGLDPGSCYPSHRRLGELVGKSARTVQRPIRVLEAKGWVSRVKRFDARGDRLSDGYIVRVSPLLPDDTDAQGCAPPAQICADPPRKTARTPRANMRVQEREQVERKQENEKTRARRANAARVDGFDDFWAVWPRKEAKLVARKAWDKATEATAASTIIAGAVRYADDPNREQSHTTHPATWLNGARWEDDPLPARNGQTKTDRSMDAIRRVLLADQPDTMSGRSIEAEAR